MEKETGSTKVLTEKGVRDSVCEEGLNTYSPTLFLICIRYNETKKAFVYKRTHTHTHAHTTRGQHNTVIMETTTADDAKIALLSKLIAQSRAELDELETHFVVQSSSETTTNQSLRPTFSTLKQLVRELEKEGEGGEGKEENSTSSTFKPPKGAVRIPGMEAGGALGKEFLQNLKLKNNTNNTKGEEEEGGDEATREQSTPAAPKPAWMIELVAKKAAARAKEEE